MLEDIALSGIYEMTLDKKFRTSLPSDFDKEIKRNIGTDYYLLTRYDEVGRSLVIEPTQTTDYRELVKKMNKKGKNDPERLNFFRHWRKQVDGQGRVFLGEYLAKLLGAHSGEKVYFVGCGNYCKLVKSSTNI